MILLLGGTSETALVVQGLHQAGLQALVSMATDIPLRAGEEIGIRRRIGELDTAALVNLIRDEGITQVVDVTHPYAVAVSANARTACRRTNIPYAAYNRAGVVEDGPDIHRAGDHEAAASLACSFGLPILLTIGTRWLAVYVAEIRCHGLRVVVRVLDHRSSLEACFQAGLKPTEVIAAHGPFSQEDNASVIRRHSIGVLVTKDSGEAGGVGDKLRAARDYGCQVVVVDRPPPLQGGYGTVDALLEAVVSRSSKFS